MFSQSVITPMSILQFSYINIKERIQNSPMISIFKFYSTNYLETIEFLQNIPIWNEVLLCSIANFTLVNFMNIGIIFIIMLGIGKFQYEIVFSPHSFINLIFNCNLS